MSATPAALPDTQPAPAQPRRRLEPRDLMAFGSGVAIRIAGSALEMAVVRVRPSGARVAAAHVIERFRERPAAEWGREYSEFLVRNGAGHLAATVLLPRPDVIVRQLSLPVVSNQEVDAALGYQVESLHPYGDEEVSYAWMRLGRGGALLVGIIRRQTLDRYIDLFAEAGIACASFTFSAAVLYSALRLLRKPDPAGCLVFFESEMYGESPARPLFSAEFDEAPERAEALARAELRLGQDVTAQPAANLLTPPVSAPDGYDLSRNALAYATALAGACPRLTPFANLLPVERRTASSRAMFVPTAVLGVLLAVASITAFGYSKYIDSSYLGRLEAEIARLEPDARRAAQLDAEIANTRARTRLLDEFRAQSKANLDALTELTTLLPPPIWLNSLELTRDTALIAGEAEQAAALLSLLDSSPLFRNSAFAMPIAKTPNMEGFRIRAEREARQ